MKKQNIPNLNLITINPYVKDYGLRILMKIRATIRS